MSEVNELRLGIQRCDYCGGIKDHFDEKSFEGYLCPHCDADKITDLGKQNERRWMFENAVMRHTRTMTER